MDYQKYIIYYTERSVVVQPTNDLIINELVESKEGHEVICRWGKHRCSIVCIIYSYLYPKCECGINSYKCWAMDLLLASYFVQEILCATNSSYGTHLYKIWYTGCAAQTVAFLQKNSLNMGWDFELENL